MNVSGGFLFPENWGYSSKNARQYFRQALKSYTSQNLKYKEAKRALTILVYVLTVIVFQSGSLLGIGGR